MPKRKVKTPIPSLLRSPEYKKFKKRWEDVVLWETFWNELEELLKK